MITKTVYTNKIYRDKSLFFIIFQSILIYFPFVDFKTFLFSDYYNFFSISTIWSQKQMKRNKIRHARIVFKYVTSGLVFIGWVCYALNVYMQRSVPYWSYRQHIGLLLSLKKKKKKALISYARISYYKQVKKKGGFFPSSKVQTNRQIAHVHKDLPLPTSSTTITKKPP